MENGPAVKILVLTLAIIICSFWFSCTREAVACGGADGNCIIDTCACLAGLSQKEGATCECGSVCMLHGSAPDNPVCSGSTACNCKFNAPSSPGGCECGRHCKKSPNPCGMARLGNTMGEVCACGYIYCTCGKTCSGVARTCGEDDECDCEGKDPWLELAKQKPLPNRLSSGYLEGLVLLSAGKPAPAAATFQRLIDEEYIDCRFERKRDLAFRDFFPRREYGVAQYMLGNYSEAVRVLEDSLKGEETARAQRYLDLARLGVLRETARDKAPPEILLKFAAGAGCSDPFTGVIMGKISDDSFVSRVSLNGRDIPLWLSQPEVTFEEKITLHKGANEFTVSTLDLTGKKSEKTFSVYADTDAPLVALDYQLLEEGAVLGQRVSVSGTVTDDLQVREIVLNGRILEITPDREVSFQETISLSLWESEVVFQAKDLLGNVARGELCVERPGRAARGPRLARLEQDKAHDGPRFPLIGFRETSEAESPLPLLIELRDISDGQTFFFDSVYLAGRVSSFAPIVTLSVNGEPFRPGPGANVFFNTIIKLKKGENRISVKAEDAAGRTALKRLTLFRKVPRYKDLASRMSISILPFNQRGAKKDGRLKDVVYHKLISAFIEQKRFNLVERGRLEEILLEQKLSRKELVKRSTIIKLGEIVAADALMVGAIYERGSGIEVFARLVDTTTGVVIAAGDVWCQDKERDNLGLVLEGLALKFKNKFPLVEGMVLKRDKVDVFQDLGCRMGMKPYRKLVVYRDNERVVHPVTGEVLGIDAQELGEVMIEKVFDDMSRGNVLKEEKGNRIREEDRVVSK